MDEHCIFACLTIHCVVHVVLFGFVVLGWRYDCEATAQVLTFLPGLASYVYIFDFNYSRCVCLCVCVCVVDELLCSRSF